MSTFERPVPGFCKAGLTGAFPGPGNRRKARIFRGIFTVTKNAKGLEADAFLT